MRGEVLGSRWMGQEWVKDGREGGGVGVFGWDD